MPYKDKEIEKLRLRKYYADNREMLIAKRLLNRDKINSRRRDIRNGRAISSEVLREMRFLEISKGMNKEEVSNLREVYRKFPDKRYMASRKKKGDLTTKTLQLVYEDNIKKYGTLTCYLCVEPIEFGWDSLEHKTPLSRGGTHEFNNLAVACFRCNAGKQDRTEEEYRKAKL